jgi:IS5 family transposase
MGTKVMPAAPGGTPPKKQARSDAVKVKAQTGRRLTIRQRYSSRRFGEVCAKVEHVFRVLKCQFGYRKARYRALAKNAAQVFSLLAFANLYLARRTRASARG